MGSRGAVFGVDFSGARDAGRNIWVAEGRIEGDGLAVEDVFPVEGGARERNAALEALREFIQERPGAVFGMDFPFGLPRPLVMRENWVEFVRCFPEDFGDPEEFREFCHQVAGGRERRRETDVEAGASMSPYNRRTYRMTFYGVRDVLNPLLGEGSAVALPMQDRAEGAAWLMEVCPACTLKEEGVYRSYRGPEERCRDARRDIAGEVSGWGVSFGGGVRERVVEDRGGDALDAVLAAFAVFRGLEREEFWCLGDLLEGCIVH